MIDVIKIDSNEQIAEVAQLAREIWQEHYVPIVGQAQVTYMIEKFQSEQAITAQLADRYEYYAVVQDGRKKGYLAVVPDLSKSTLMISKIYVKKSARGQGMGWKMLAFAENLCRRRNLKSLWLTVNKNNTHSIRWYSRMGFTNAGPTFKDIGAGFVMDDYRMEKPVGKKSDSDDA